MRGTPASMFLKVEIGLLSWRGQGVSFGVLMNNQQGARKFRETPVWVCLLLEYPLLSEREGASPFCGVP